MLEGWLDAPGGSGPAARHPRARRRPAGLSSYMLESKGPLRRQAGLEHVRWRMVDTGVPGLKIMSVTPRGGAPRQCFVEVGDKRFVTIHSSGSSRDAERVVGALACGPRAAFDGVWLYHGMLDHIARKVGDGLVGFAVRYAGGLLARAGARRCAPALEGLNVHASGSNAGRLAGLMKRDGGLREALAYRSVRIRCGSAGDESGYVHDEITGTGRFAVKHGRSVKNHLDIVEESKKIYSRAVAGVEDCRLGASNAPGEPPFRGRALNFALSRGIADIDQFIGTLFNSARPFRLSGIKSLIEPGYYQVLAVDLLTGDPVTFEIASGMMRVYLQQRSSGGIVMRLLANLQASYGTSVRCREVDKVVG